MPKHPIILFLIFISLLFSLPEPTHAEIKATEEIDLLIEVDIDRIIERIVDQLVIELKQGFRKERPFSLLKTVPYGTTIHLHELTYKDKVIETVRNFDDRLEITSSANNKIIEVQVTEESKRQIAEHAVRQTIDIIRSRANMINNHRLKIQRQNHDDFIITLAGIKDPDSLLFFINRRSLFKFHLIDKTIKKVTNISLPMADDNKKAILISRRAIMQSDQITDIQPSVQDGRPVVVFNLSRNGAKHFCDLTKTNLGKSFAIVLDNKIIETSHIKTTACNGKGVIIGNMTKEKADDLAVLLSAYRGLPEFKVKEGFTSKMLNEAKQHIH